MDKAGPLKRCLGGEKKKREVQKKKHVHKLLLVSRKVFNLGALKKKRQ
jgi:hypothetical protein